ncbi:hypothetical protein B0T24DRAFT_139214 [Lasiosphaeria ovina]|uniref:Uncharacterized protein n=1 Tax=Lasiosphaeria ovina TaxID=92902 RepID=A0AAE0KLD3_9PEZI|nr:hypothetical protein B0T24DRAFT_139214 [Lasiosphaeria ovina]
MKRRPCGDKRRDASGWLVTYGWLGKRRGKMIPTFLSLSHPSWLLLLLCPGIDRPSGYNNTQHTNAHTHKHIYGSRARDEPNLPGLEESCWTGGRQGEYIRRHNCVVCYLAVSVCVMDGSLYVFILYIYILFFALLLWFPFLFRFVFLFVFRLLRHRVWTLFISSLGRTHRRPPLSGLGKERRECEQLCEGRGVEPTRVHLVLAAQP